MKKLMIAMAIAASAVVVNAANVNWQLTTFYTPKATAAGKLTVNSTKNTTGDKMPVGGMEFALYIVDWSSGSAGAETLLLGSDKIDFTEAGKMASAVLWSQADAESKRDTYGNNGTVYLKLVGTYSDGNYDYVYTSTASKDLKNIAQSTQTYTFMGGTTDAWTATAAPEPTSGLLLLLGVAGLALRRRRA